MTAADPPSGPNPTETPGPASAVASIGPSGGPLRVEVEASGHAVVADEPSGVGGTNAGPDPFGLLYSSLAACVLMTVRMYADRKGWPIRGARVRVAPERRPGGPLERAELELEVDAPDLDADQTARLRDIAGRCPVHRTLEAGVGLRFRDATG